MERLDVSVISYQGCKQFKILVFAGLLILGQGARGDGVPEGSCGIHLEPQEVVNVAHLDPESSDFAGLTDEGIEVLKTARRALLQRQRLFGSEIKNLETVHHGALVSRLHRSNMLLSGAGGGAKSMFVEFMMRGEVGPIYRILMHQMVTEQALVGGQDLRAAELGKYIINSEGSMADAVVANLEEIEKANPGALATVMSLLNEREIWNGTQLVKAKVETVFASTNASLPELVDFFRSDGQATTALPFLNRFSMKAYVQNWLPQNYQAELDERRERKERLEALAPSYPEVLRDEVFLQPEQIDWYNLRRLAALMFKPTPALSQIYREFAENFKQQTFNAIRESENQLDSSQGYSHVYVPAFDPTERVRQSIPSSIKMSAMIDFLLSPLASDEMLENLGNQPIDLGPASLWRAHLTMTTLAPGETRLVIDDSGKVSIEWGKGLDPERARDSREAQLITELLAEQSRFQRLFDSHLEKYQKEIQKRIRYSPSPKKDSNKSTLEAMLLHYSRD